MLDQRVFALNPSVGDLANLIAVEMLPRLSVEVLVERNQVHRIDEVDERVANIAPILVIISTDLA